jgi:AraC-like DNA-binding protein
LDYTVGTTPPSTTPSSMVIGMHQRAVISESRGCKMIQVEFPPAAAYALFGLPLRELAGQFVDLSQVFGQSAEDLAERLAGVPDWAGRFAVLQGAIVRRLAIGSAPHKEVAWAYQRIDRSQGKVSIADLAAEVGWSRRHLTRRFSEQFGLAPKTVARLRRLHNALRLLSRPGRRSIADIAARCGYYDQAHLDLDFRDIAGCSPKEYLAEIKAETVRANGDTAA